MPAAPILSIWDVRTCSSTSIVFVNSLAACARGYQPASASIPKITQASVPGRLAAAAAAAAHPGS